MSENSAKSSNSEKSNLLISAPIPEMVRKIGIPVSIGAFFSTMFNVVDTYFAGTISNDALAALALSFPIFFIIIAFTFGLQSGSAALIGNALGAKDKENAERFAVQGIVFGFVCSIFVTIVGLSIAAPLFRVLGASGEYLDIALSYIIPIFYGTVLFAFVQTLNAILNSIGKTGPYRNVLIVAFLLNIVLDPWFINGGLGVPALGITGIALATLLAQLVRALYLGYHVYRSGVISRQRLLKNLLPQPKAFMQISRQAFPSILDLGMNSIGFFVLTFFVSKFGQEAVGAFGAASRLEQIALLPALALDVATLALVAQNNGAGLKERVKATFNTGILYGLIVLTTGAALLFVFARPLMEIFSDDPEVINIGVTFIRIRVWALPAAPLYFVAAATLRGIKQPTVALLMNFSRFVVIPIIGITIFVQLLGYGLLAIWWISLATLVIMSLFAYFYARRIVFD